MRDLRPVSLLLCTVLGSCQTPRPYAPEPQPAVVESVEVSIRDFHGRPEAIATVKGHLSSGVAQLVDSKQSRDGDRLYLEVLEQTPRGATLTGVNDGYTDFEQRIPLELLGLMPGDYVLVTNGIETPLTIPGIQAETYAAEPPPSGETPPVRIIDEFIPIEESEFVDPQHIYADPSGA